MARIRIQTLFLISLGLFVLAACNYPGFQESSISRDLAGSIVKFLPGAAVTPTPFQPVKDPTGSELLSSVSPDNLRWRVENCPDFPPPSQGSYIDLPEPVCPQLPEPENQFDILLLGSDQRAETGGFRTDIMILLTLNPAQNTISMTSFPRDLYVYIPGWSMQRVNTAHAHGGFEATQLTYQYNFGVRPDRYVMINFGAFQDLITSLGGIDVQVAESLTDHRSGYGSYTVPAGLTHMDAETALWYVRSRYSTSDFERNQRQQEVLVAIFNRLISLDGISRAPEIFGLYKESVTTDLTFPEMLQYLPLAGQLLDGNNVRRYSIGRPQVTSWRTPGGAQVLLPNREAVLAVMQEALNSQQPGPSVQ
ncbi:MAG: LCP family protein [Anaerolineales bacterium]|nr:LCP family protein [Anaerolineales bacterium]